MPTVWINGSFVDEESAAVSVRDTGLLHAAGVFTTMRAYGGKVFRVADHLGRLCGSCQALSIPITPSEVELADAIDHLLKRNGLSAARLRLTATRGMARQSPEQGLRLEPTVFITAADLEPYPPEYYQRGLTAVLVDDQKLNPYDVQAGHKTLNYFSRLAALREANRRGAGEALWFDVDNRLQSGSISNIFLVKEGKLLTPPTPADLLDPVIARKVPYRRSAVLPGVTRAVVFELARAIGITAAPAALDVNAVLSADEIFVTNSIMGIMPVCRIERHAVGDDKPGPITRKLSDAYAREVDLTYRLMSGS
jgi:branched-chain amino acid aminotransferase